LLDSPCFTFPSIVLTHQIVIGPIAGIRRDALPMSQFSRSNFSSRSVLVLILGLIWSLDSSTLSQVISIQPAKAEDPKPNVVLILADDLGWADLSCYGSKFHQTPNLDKLASEGVRFTQAYAACPVCSPTRVAVLTGKYPQRFNLTDWLPGRGDLPDQRLKRPQIRQALPLEAVTLAEVLKPVGRALAAMVGRPGDLAARYHRDEFALVLASTDGPGAFNVSEQVRQSIEGFKLPAAKDAPRRAPEPGRPASGGAGADISPPRCPPGGRRARWWPCGHPCHSRSSADPGGSRC